MPSPFHGGFGLINFQGLRKPSFYAYQFLNRLGAEELVSDDPNSWATRGGGGVQVLFWNYTPPQTKESNQVYFKRDLPSKAIGDDAHLTRRLAARQLHVECLPRRLRRERCLHRLFQDGLAARR